MPDSVVQPTVPPPLPAPPPNVASAAAAGGMGELQLAQRGDNPFATFLFMLVVTAGCVGLMIGFGWLGATIEVRAVALLALPCLAGAIVCFVWAFMALFRGFRDNYLYEHGLVHRNNWKIQVLPWRQLDEVWLWKAGGNTALRGKLLSYVAVSFDGLKIAVPAITTRDKEGLLGAARGDPAGHRGHAEPPGRVRPRDRLGRRLSVPRATE